MKLDPKARFNSKDAEIEIVDDDYIEEEPEVDEEPQVQMYELSEFELEERLQEAYNAGYDEGSEATKQELETKISEQFSAFQTLLTQFDQAQEQFFNSVQHYIINISKLIAKKIIERELQTDIAIITELVNESLGKLKESNKFRVFLSTKDYDILHAHNFHEELGFTSEKKIEVLCRESLQAGSFFIESDAGNLYFIIDEQLNRLTNEI